MTLAIAGAPGIAAAAAVHKFSSSIMGGSFTLPESPESISKFSSGAGGYSPSYSGSSPYNTSFGQAQQEYIQVEDYDEQLDGKFVRELMVPYMRDLYKDLALRSLAPAAIKEKKLDKVTFIKYCNLPGIICERLLKVFDSNNDGMITEASFIQNLTKIFISDLETRLQFTFNM
jgi:hypothetical protein